jgi:3-phenylpropionate/trans-cinnamate dioxygenase ferredoxin subunit
MMNARRLSTRESMAKYLVAAVDELPPGTRKIVEVAGRSIGVFNINGEFFALRNRCPHQGGPLCEGRLAGFLESAGVGEFIYSRAGEILRCPWHGWEYDIRTGQSYFDPRHVRVRAYEVDVEPGSGVPPDAGSAATVTTIPAGATKTSGESGLRKGPYVAETYPVSVESRYIMVEIAT